MENQWNLDVRPGGSGPIKISPPASTFSILEASKNAGVEPVDDFSASNKHPISISASTLISTIRTARDPRRSPGSREKKKDCSLGILQTLAM